MDGCGKSRPPPGFDPRTFQPVESRYTDYATLDNNKNEYEGISLGVKYGRRVELTTLPSQLCRMSK